ncbi:MAG: PaaI family thioesterase [Propionibacterium sp.]
MTELPALDSLTDPTPLSRFMGIETLEVSPEHAVARMPVAPNTQPYGRLAGGATILLCEGIASRAASLHARGLGKIALGLEVNTTHHSGATSGHVTAIADAIHLGRTVATYNVTVTGQDGRLVSTARVSCILVDTPARPSVPSH